MTATTASGYDDVTPGTMAALGGAGAAHAHDNGALTSNPAAMGLSRRYMLNLYGGLFNGRDTRFSFSGVDALTPESYAFGIAYNYERARSVLSTEELPGWISADADVPNEREFHAFTAGLAIPLLRRRLSFGVTGQFVLINHAVLDSKRSGDLTVGIAGRPTEEWSVGVAVRDILPAFAVTDDTVGLTAGTRYAWGPMTSVALDVDVPFEATEGLPFSIRTGAEFEQDYRHIAIGYRFEGPVSEHWLSAGAGIFRFTNPEEQNGSLVGLHYALQAPLHKAGPGWDQLAAIRHTITISMMPSESRN